MEQNNLCEIGFALTISLPGERVGLPHHHGRREEALEEALGEPLEEAPRP